jgi:hypothetical protein
MAAAIAVAGHTIAMPFGPRLVQNETLAAMNKAAPISASLQGQLDRRQPPAATGAWSGC